MMERSLFLGGEFVSGRGHEIRNLFPGDGELVGTMNAATEDDVNDAVACACEAQRQESWRSWKPHERATILYGASQNLLARADELAKIQSYDNGKTLKETKALVQSAAATIRYVAATLETIEEEITPQRGECLTMSVFDPIGVVGAITPWNSPIASDAQKISPALAAGNAVILKPAEWTPFTALELARAFDEAGLPKGLLSVLPGKGSVVGDAIVRHPKIRKISFTGGTNTGRRILHHAADKIMQTSTELGGKSPNIVFADADMDHALAGVIYGIFSSNGQACIAGSRVFVQRSVYGDFLERLVSSTKALRVGHPFDDATQVSPLITAAHRETVEGYVELARSEGAEVVCGGYRPEVPDYENGFYYSPTILTGLANDARTCQEEIFGPVAVVLPFEEEDDLIAMANDSVFGLASGIWTRDYKRAWRVARRLEAGTVWINTYKQFSPTAPFGGVKESGMGREKGRHWIRSYMNQKSLYFGLNEDPLPWAK